MLLIIPKCWRGSIIKLSILISWILTGLQWVTGFGSLIPNNLQLSATENTHYSHVYKIYTFSNSNVDFVSLGINICWCLSNSIAKRKETICILDYAFIRESGLSKLILRWVNYVVNSEVGELLNFRQESIVNFRALKRLIFSYFS